MSISFGVALYIFSLEAILTFLPTRLYNSVRDDEKIVASGGWDGRIRLFQLSKVRFPDQALLD